MLNLLSVIVEIQEIIGCRSTVEEAKLEPNFFTRNRKLSFSELVLLILNGVHTSTQTALNRFFAKHLDVRNTCSQQALSKARSHFDHSPFEKMFRSCVKMRYCGKHEIATMYGYQIMAVDGSDIALPDTPKLLSAFGGEGRNADSPTAKASILYDVLNDFILDAALEKSGTSERDMAFKHMEKLQEIAPEERKLLIFDRGYPSSELIEKLGEYGYNFLMRVRKKWNNDVDAIYRDGEVVLSSGRNVRVVKIQLPGGEEETLITNLFDLPTAAFCELYFKRWPIETKYDMIKNKLAIENFSGYTENVIMQDFWANMQLANMAAVAKDEANAVIQKERAGKKNKYTYVANVNQIIASLREHLVTACFASTEAAQNHALEIVYQEIQRAVVPIRPGRSVERPANPRNAKYHHNRKLN